MFRSLFRISLKEAPTFSTRRDQHLSVISARSRGWRWQDGKRLPSAQDQVIIWPNDVRTHHKMFGPLGIFSICPKDWDEVGNGQCHLSLYVFTTSTLQVSLELHFEPVRMTSTLHYGARHSRHKGMKFYPTSRHRKQDKWAGKTSKAKNSKIERDCHILSPFHHPFPLESGRVWRWRDLY